jgi:hypothetical protein
MTQKNLFKFSLINLIIGIAVLLIAFFFFHFVTDSGITTVFQKEAGKPFVTLLIGIFGVLFVFASAISALSALVFFDGTKENDAES